MDGVKSQVIKYQYISTLWWRKWITNCKKMDGIKRIKKLITKKIKIITRIIRWKFNL